MSTLPLEITFRNIEPSEALAARIRSLAAKLGRFSARIIQFHVVVEAPHHRHHHHGGLFDFKIDIQLPGKEISIGHVHTRDPAHANAYVALRDAFRAARRQLQQYETQHRQD
ncbi:MAG TPA: HPF/RaiA family ribosome-associated protein [Steroidobacteraceae bacterium]